MNTWIAALITAGRELFNEPVKHPTHMRTLDGEAIAIVKDGYKPITLATGHVEAVRHTLHDIDGLCDWLEKRSDQVTADVSFDEKTGVFRAHAGDTEAHARIECHLQAHPRRTRWQEIKDKDLSQREVVLLLRATEKDWPVTALVGGEEHRQGEQIRRQIQKLTIKKDFNFEAEIQPNGQTTMRAVGQKDTMSATLPDTVIVRFPWWSCLSDEVAVKFAIEVNSDKPERPFRFVALDWDEAQLAAGGHVTSAVRNRLPEHLIFLGRAERRPVGSWLETPPNPGIVDGWRLPRVRNFSQPPTLPPAVDEPPTYGGPAVCPD